MLNQKSNPRKEKQVSLCFPSLCLFCLVCILVLWIWRCLIWVSERLHSASNSFMAEGLTRHCSVCLVHLGICRASFTWSCVMAFHASIFKHMFISLSKSSPLWVSQLAPKEIYTSSSPDVCVSPVCMGELHTDSKYRTVSQMMLNGSLEFGGG